MKPHFAFYAASKRCPDCKGALLTTSPLTREMTQGLLHRLGVSCYCVECNSRFRATGKIRFGWVSWLGSFGKWIWWEGARLQKTLEAPGSN